MPETKNKFCYVLWVDYNDGFGHFYVGDEGPMVLNLACRETIRLAKLHTSERAAHWYMEAMEERLNDPRPVAKWGVEKLLVEFLNL